MMDEGKSQAGPLGFVPYFLPLQSPLTDVSGKDSKSSLQPVPRDLGDRGHRARHGTWSFLPELL